MLQLVADIALGSLLVVTAVWCALVHHRLRRLRTERGEMEGFITALTAATERAEAAITGLRETLARADRDLREQGELARQRAGELVRLIEDGGRVLGRLDAGGRRVDRVSGGAPAPRERQAAVAGPAIAPAGAQFRGSAAADELLKALGSLR